jgi:16S rRNA (guanine1516-N2)-methyltransferase
LAQHLDLPLVSAAQLDPDQFPYTLQYQSAGLCLQASAGKAGPVQVDFARGASLHRRKQGGGELIVKAIGGDRRNLPSVMDVTAGLGRDSFVLACKGYAMTLCERSPIIAALLDDGLARAQALVDEGAADAELLAVLQRMTLQPGDALLSLNSLSETACPDVIYLDPMFPASKKSALVKKEMQAFQQVVGEDDSGEALLLKALQLARHRVVVKRPSRAPHLADQKPSYSLSGKAVRFDVYALKAYPK